MCESIVATLLGICAQFAALALRNFEVYENIKYKITAPGCETHIRVIVAVLCVRLSVCLSPQRVPIAPSLSMASSMRDGIERM